MASTYYNRTYAHEATDPKYLQNEACKDVLDLSHHELVCLAALVAIATKFPKLPWALATEIERLDDAPANATSYLGKLLKRGLVECKKDLGAPWFWRASARGRARVKK